MPGSQGASPVALALTTPVVGHSDTASEQEILHLAVAQGAPRRKPDPVADNFTGKAVVLVARGVGWRGHTWGSILGCI